jgi:RimJ/RimL family protein N-acetyltransferase
VNLNAAAPDVTLRPWTRDDAAQVAEAAQDPHIRSWNPIIGDAEEWCAARADWSDGTHASWAVTSAEQPAIVLGSVSLFNIDTEQERGEIGFWTATAHRGRGIATHALRKATTYGSRTLGLRRIALYHAVENLGSCRVAAGVGYALEGVHRQAHRYGDGEWHDEHCHAWIRDSSAT